MINLFFGKRIQLIYFTYLRHWNQKSLQ